MVATATLTASMDPRSGWGLPEGDVTMLFSDIEGSTRLLQEIGELYGDVLAEHHRVLREVWGAHSGVEVHSDGDAFLIVFLEARGAVRAAAAAQGALGNHTWPHDGQLRVRMGIHTGNVQVRHDDYWGIDVHYAARLCSAAHGGQVLLSATTRALVPDASADDLGEHALKDFPAARKLFHLNLPGRTSADFPPPRSLETVRTNLPSVSARLIGREREVEAVRAQFAADARVVTVTGVGGSGKTRLALACGDALLDTFPDGVFLVSLASLRDEDRVTHTIGHAVGAPVEGDRDPEPMLAQHLARRELLLIVDNMEHLLGAAPLVSRLVDGAPGLRVLATSQAPLRVQHEFVMPLESLAVPLRGEEDLDVLEAVPAVALFAERARASDPAFALTAQNARAVAELCRRLDGLPLALELAAARIRLGGPQRLLSGLERGIDALGSGARDLPERQRGLRAALDWTVSLLGEDERELFAALGVFADAWTIEQLEQMFGDELDVWEASASLMDFSLIRTRGDGRFTMAETVRTYAQTMLEERGRTDDCRSRHARMLAEEAEAIHDELMLDFNAQVARTVDLVREFSAAIEWAAGRDPALHRRLVGAIGLPYYYAGHLATVRDDLIALAAADEGADAVSARLFLSQSRVLISRADWDSGSRSGLRAVEASRRLGDQRSEALALIQTAHMLSFLGQADFASGPDLLDAARALPPAHADRRIRDLIDGVTAITLFTSNSIDEAEPILAGIVADSRRTDFSADFASSYMADCALMRRRYDDALARGVDCVRKMRLTQIHNVLLQCLAIVMALAGLGRDSEAIELLAAIGAVGEREGIELPTDLYDLPELLPASRERLGVGAVAQAEHRGRNRELEDIVSWVLSMPVPAGIV
jgi:predicted ATPase/class 3 adenylate cyclase